MLYCTALQCTAVHFTAPQCNVMGYISIIRLCMLGFDWSWPHSTSMLYFHMVAYGLSFPKEYWAKVTGNSRFLLDDTSMPVKCTWGCTFVLCEPKTFLADPGEARGCSTNTSVINWLIDSFSDHLWKNLYGAVTPKWFKIMPPLIK